MNKQTSELQCLHAELAERYPAGLDFDECMALAWVLTRRPRIAVVRPGRAAVPGVIEVTDGKDVFDCRALALRALVPGVDMVHKEDVLAANYDQLNIYDDQVAEMEEAVRHALAMCAAEGEGGGGGGSAADDSDGTEHPSYDLVPEPDDGDDNDGGGSAPCCPPTP